MEVWDFRPQEETGVADAGGREYGDHIMVDINEAGRAESVGPSYTRASAAGESFEDEDRMAD